MKKRYVEVGVGGRATYYYRTLSAQFKDAVEIAAVCDISQTRMNYVNKVLTEEYGVPPAKTYFYTDFEKMLDEIRPDGVIITSVDRTHDYYIIRAMEKGYDVICEKPLTIDEKKCQAIIDCQKRTGRKLRVIFNMRYVPYVSKIKEILLNRVIGDVFSVHFEWLLDINHGAEYFRRWHRNKYNSGGLQIHKATHHFDMVNFWLGSRPDTVFAMGDLNFYGMKNAERRGVKNFYYRCHGSQAAKDDPFAIDIASDPLSKAIYLDAEADSGYIRDKSVFSEEISIEDTLGVMVRYQNNVIMTYSLNAYMPWEGFNININGSEGRLEVVDKRYIYAGCEGEDGDGINRKPEKRITVRPMFGKPYEVSFQELSGSHGGGDDVLLNDIFGSPGPDPLNRAASHIDGAYSMLIGAAVNRSIASGLPVRIQDLVNF